MGADRKKITVSRLATFGIVTKPCDIPDVHSSLHSCIFTHKKVGQNGQPQSHTKVGQTIFEKLQKLNEFISN